MAPVEAYEGIKPYIFISYAHKDSARVLPVIESLTAAGYRVWYDGGIEAGSEWPEYIAGHLKKSACVLAFLSDAFVNSQNCRQELTFAQNLRVPMLNVYLEDVRLSDGMQMQLGLNQCIFLKNFASHGAFMKALCRAEILAACCEIEEVTKEQNAFSPIKKAQRTAEPPPAPPSQVDKNIKLFEGVIWLFEIVRVVAAIFCMNLVSAHFSNFFALLGLNAIPHVIITLVERLLFNKLTAGATEKQAYQADSDWSGPIVLAFLVSLIASAFYINSTDSIFLKILITLGIHLILLFVTMMLTPNTQDPDKPKESE